MVGEYEARSRFTQLAKGNKTFSREQSTYVDREAVTFWSPSMLYSELQMYILKTPLIQPL